MTSGSPWAGGVAAAPAYAFVLVGTVDLRLEAALALDPAGRVVLLPETNTRPEDWAELVDGLWHRGHPVL